MASEEKTHQNFTYDESSFMEEESVEEKLLFSLMIFGLSIFYYIAGIIGIFLLQGWPVDFIKDCHVLPEDYPVPEVRRKFLGFEFIWMQSEINERFIEFRDMPFVVIFGKNISTKFFPLILIILSGLRIG